MRKFLSFSVFAITLILAGFSMNSFAIEVGKTHCPKGCSILEVKNTSWAAILDYKTINNATVCGADGSGQIGGWGAYTKMCVSAQGDDGEQTQIYIHVSGQNVDKHPHAKTTINVGLPGKISCEAHILTQLYCHFTPS